MAVSLTDGSLHPACSTRPCAFPFARGRRWPGAFTRIYGGERGDIHRLQIRHDIGESPDSSHRLTPPCAQHHMASTHPRHTSTMDTHELQYCNMRQAHRARARAAAEKQRRLRMLSQRDDAKRQRQRAPALGSKNNTIFQGTLCQASSLSRCRGADAEPLPSELIIGPIRDWDELATPACKD